MVEGIRLRTSESQETWLSRKNLPRYTLLALAAIALLNGISSFIYCLHNGALSNKHPSKEMLDSLHLTDTQCKIMFPGLTKEIDDAVARGPFDLKKQNANYTGMVQGRIRDGNLYIISVDRNPSRDMFYERTAVLHQLHRAIITSPEPITDTAFILTILDTPLPNVWSFSRSNDPNSKGNFWVMPHFSGWSWPKPFIGTLDQALSEIDRIEKETSWDDKIDKAVWRGTGQFNSVGNIALRPNLLHTTKGKQWADVELLEWGTNAVNAKNAIRIEDFCKYKYIIYTEGITYSGRLPFHQSCNSIILTPPPNYLLHTTQLMRPLFSSSLPFSHSSTSSVGRGANPRWPQFYEPTEANVVFVEYDWADLEQTINWLRAHPDIARGIAKRQREMISGKGYLSPAAENCYWRALINGWSQVAKTDSDEKWDEGEEIRWETFSLTGKTERG